MGRNAVPKLDVWDEGSLYRFRYAKEEDGFVSNVTDGKFVIFEKITNVNGEKIAETLATFHADGLHDALACMFFDGYTKGMQAGRKSLQQEIRRLLDLASSIDFSETVEALKHRSK